MKTARRSDANLDMLVDNEVVDNETDIESNEDVSTESTAPTRTEPLPEARTLAESLRLKLEKDILEGHLLPGQKLDEEELASRFGLSRTPVREAIKALSSSGLLDVRQHQGAYVATLTLQTIAEMFEVMAMIETQCAELAARRHHSQDRTAIKEACQACSDATTTATFNAANVKFHEALYAAAHNTYLQAQALAIRQRLEPYLRQISYHEGLIDKSNHEHEAVAKAVLAMDDEAARLAMRTHFFALSNDVAAIASLVPTPAVTPTRSEAPKPARRPSRSAASRSTTPRKASA